MEKLKNLPRRAVHLQVEPHLDVVAGQRVKPGEAGAEGREAEGSRRGEAGRRPLEVEEGGGVGRDAVVVGGAGEVAESGHCFGSPFLPWARR